MSAGKLTIRALTLLVALAWAAAPAVAHKKHHHEPANAAQAQPPSGEATDRQGQQPEASSAMRDHMAAMPGMEEDEEDRTKMGTVERALDWLGRLHPVIVHFPIAFLTAGLVTAIVGRRRPAFAKPVQFLVVAGGFLAPVAVVLGWLDGGIALVDTDPLLRVHRWLGTAIGVAALALALWALRRPEHDRSPGMIVGLAIVTAAIVIQGWYGGAMVHGVDHMSW
jgi:uncharacterized membrane protein